MFEFLKVPKLLMRIAHLEGITDAVEHRRSSEEVLNKLGALHNLMLQAEVQEKDSSIVKAQVNILRWVVGKA